MPDWIKEAGVTAYPLILCSLISLAVIFDRALFWMKHRAASHTVLREKVIDYVRQSRINEALKVSEGSEDYLVKIYREGLNHHELSFLQALEIGVEKELKSMKKYLTVLDTIITLSPLLGILGTIFGIISSFDVLGAAGLQDPKLVTGGIAEALISTAMGLSIAILTLIPFNYFQSLIESKVSDMQSQVTNFELMYNKGSRSSF
ncbi:hypothetical protein AB834_05470 [PVC group bacterium (ex Bugula neritina AB1)]|nr:hypothetical protein AB834_05470 [PVC group bacterium (ex Bugula neritina AB1)]